jgi:hypothetical protein
MVVEAAASAIGGVGAFSTYVRINKYRVVVDGLGIHRAKLGHTVAAPYALAPSESDVILRQVPGGEGVVGVDAALPRLVCYLDGTAGGEPPGREIEYHPLRDRLVFGVVRVVRVENSVDPTARTIGGRARSGVIGALLKYRDGGLCRRGGAGARAGAPQSDNQPQ